ncbi:MAG: T9SS type A sorting domain-containing protein [Chitinophagaceae bacterium]
MKKCILYFVFFFAARSLFAQELVDASVGNGASANKVDLFIRNNDVNPINAKDCDNLVFTIRVPISAGSSITVAETYHDAAFAHLTFDITKFTVNDGAYYYYLINGTGAVAGGPPANILPGISYRVLELTFSGGSSAQVQLVNLENDIPLNLLIKPQFYFQLNTGDVTDYTSMFYGTAGASPHNNQPPDGDDWVPTLSNVALPVIFSRYNVQCNDKGTLLTWSTSSEHNSSNFEIQRSLNATDWEVVGTMAAAGESDAEKNYQYLDISGSGILFYRIRQVDRDGHFVYTSVRRTTCGGKNLDVVVYPVPAKDVLNVVIRAEKAVTTDIQVLDASGRQVQKILKNLNSGNNSFTLDISRLPAGQYLLTSSYPEVQINKKFVVSR